MTRGIRFLVLTATLSFATATPAGPFGKLKDFVKTHPRFSTAVAVAGMTTFFEYKAAKRCHQGEIENCNGGYGISPRHNLKYVSVGFDAGLLAAAEGCWKDQPGWKFCYALAYLGPGFQTFNGVHDFVNYVPESPANKATQAVASRYFWAQTLRSKTVW